MVDQDPQKVEDVELLCTGQMEEGMLLVEDENIAKNFAAISGATGDTNGVEVTKGAGADEENAKENVKENHASEENADEENANEENVSTQKYLPFGGKPTFGIASYLPYEEGTKEQHEIDMADHIATWCFTMLYIIVCFALLITYGDEDLMSKAWKDGDVGAILGNPFAWCIVVSEAVHYYNALLIKWERVGTGKQWFSNNVHDAIDCFCHISGAFLLCNIVFDQYDRWLRWSTMFIFFFLFLSFEAGVNSGKAGCGDVYPRREKPIKSLWFSFDEDGKNRTLFGKRLFWAAWRPSSFTTMWVFLYMLLIWFDTQVIQGKEDLRYHCRQPDGSCPMGTCPLEGTDCVLDDRHINHFGHGRSREAAFFMWRTAYYAIADWFLLKKIDAYFHFSHMMPLVLPFVLLCLK